MSSIGTRLRAGLRVVGPWPIRPALLTFFTFMIYLTFQAGAAGGEPLLSPHMMRTAVLPGVLLGLPVFSIAWLGRAWQDRHGVHWPSYLLVIALLTAVAPLGRRFDIVPTDVVGGVSNVTSVFRFAGTYMLTNAVAGLVVRRLERQISATEEALDIARRQQVQILTADEEARRQASLLLHDRVQAGLIITCLELRQLSKELPSASAAKLRPLIEQLETIRSIDVRRAARALSPNLKDIDFQTAVEELVLPYETSFQVDITIDPEIDRSRGRIDPQVLLAAYRVIDQALLNTAAHAQAHHVSISFVRTVDGLEAKVVDDGVGLPQAPVRGLGSTIVTTWMRATGGSWTMESPRSGGGTTVTAVWPASTQLA